MQKWGCFIDTSAEHFRDDVATYLYLKNEGGERSRQYLCERITIEVKEGVWEPPECVRDTAKCFGRDFLQTVLDAAWEHGLRPRGYGDVKESITAIKAHLEDMRKLAGVK